MEEQKSFETEERTIFYFPIRILQAPNIQVYENLQNSIEVVEKEKILLEIPVPEKQRLCKMVDVPEGTYTCKRFASTIFRSIHRTILVLEKDEEEFPTYGFFLEQEIEILGGIDALRSTSKFLVCKVGCIRTTPNKRKCRTISIVSI